MTIQIWSTFHGMHKAELQLCACQCVNHVLNFLCKQCPELVPFLFVLHRVLPPRMLLSTTSLKKQIPSSQSIAAELYLRVTSQL